MNPIAKKAGEYRKLNEMIDELYDAVEGLKYRRELLKDEIIEESTNTPGFFNAGIGKKSSCAVYDRERIRVTFGEGLVRAKDGCKTDDQNWLVSLAELILGPNKINAARYLCNEFRLNKQLLTADYKAGILSSDDLKTLGVKFGKTIGLIVERVKSEDELKALKEKALETAAAIDGSRE
ncbi:MAG: hypothetical protein J5912_09540 [Clostridia bacterium]|nr:hypothetical protein [Clostridia bacterium]